MEVYRQATYAKDGRSSRHHGHMGLKKPNEATRQTTATLATIIDLFADAMLHKPCTFTTSEKIVENVQGTTGLGLVVRAHGPQ